MEVLKTQKGRPMLSIDGFTFIKDRQNDLKIYWKCSDKCCRSICITITEHDAPILKNPPTDHNPSPDPVFVQARQAVECMKRNAKTSHDSPSTLIQH